MPGVAEFLTGGSVFNGPFSRLLIQFLLITAFSRALGKAFTYIKEPMVISEIVAGIILGPTVLGNWEWFHLNFFPASSIPLLSAVANFGLILFMFLVGCEIDMKLLRPRLKVSLITGFTGTAVCFAVTAPLAIMIRHYDCPDDHHTSRCAADLLRGDVSFAAFYLFLGVIVSISALPVLARILTDFRILSSNLGILTIATTTIEDFIAWPLLAIALAVSGATKKITILYLFLLLAGDMLLVFLVIRPLLVLIVKHYARRDSISQMGLYMVLSLLILVSFYAEIIGLSAFIGAFQVGLVMPRRGNIIGQVSAKIEDIAVVLFLPLFFATSGQKTDLKSINTALLWLITVCIIATSCVGKILGCVPPSKLLAGFTWRESFTFGVLMNTKGLVALVSLNLGLSYGIITGKLFAMCVLMVIFNTLLTCPVVWLLNRGFFRERKETERARARVQAAERHQRKRTAMVCLQPGLLSETLSIGRLLFTAETSWLFLRLLDEADRPSTYMGPLSKKMIKRDQVLRSALEFTKMVEMPVPEVVCDVNAHFFTGVSVAAAERDPNYVMVTTDRAVYTAEEFMHDLQPLTTANTYTLVIIVDHSPSIGNRDSDRESDEMGHALSPHRTGSLSTLRGEKANVVFPYVSGTDSEEALTFAITLSSKGVPVEVIQTAERSGADANEVLRRLFSGRTVTYRMHSDDWREALSNSDAASNAGRLVLLPYSRHTVEYALSAACPVLLVKAPVPSAHLEAASARSIASLSSSSTSKESV